MNAAKNTRDPSQLQHLLERSLRGDARFLGHLQRPDADSVKILNLACGAGREAQSLASAVANLSPGPVSPTLDLVGVDLRAKEIDEAKARASNIHLPGSKSVRSEFLVADASRLHEHRELPETFDLIFVRHQNFWNGEATWSAIFDQALQKLNPGGRIVITSYFDREHTQALDAFRRQGGKVLRSVSNPNTIDLATPGKSIDRHLAIIQPQP